ncbi:aspartate--tRNA(Asn) ligase [Candidatus Nomurabacteria bacterium RIFCSPHIGHO2_01_FULL_42_15]|uniref:Aspartate--tRNA(Asn) ligase n=1 Tax=Candidatus Nomurabacteria bacterium RIFCSPHIGHO2_01_FULL_42_15 TaxID=1801742 RepID=A0A1F6VFZ6_9BACT|nr:MAG: aspartate--tRNA(Asn) ligase [Candidatus Nomurabacteria bacterium RIFCSPHIGHO2_01_FULL_42_15]OGI92993.1 MAG: aspartate--tRNA(Asn) ligase [Candidatus Nomurabacteria bacterium RIFCSPLOWO2_01_FULL_41_18]
MQNRIYIKDLKENTGKEIIIAGWVDVRRDQGKMVFFDMRDMTGKVQCVALPSRAEVIEKAKEIRPEWVLKITGLVNKRPPKNVKAGALNGDVELEVTGIEVLSKTTEIPFELNESVNLDTHLDNLPYTIRSERSKDIFTMQSSILEAYRSSLRSQGFTEFMSPGIVGGDAEGGSAVFKVDYFKDHKAYLATSPQFYKQIMVGAFERACTIAKVFRAEKSATTRHLSEITQMDFEMGFVENERDAMKVLENAVRDTVNTVGKLHNDIFTRFNTTVPLIPAEIPIFTLAEAQDLVAKEFNRTIEDTNDMSPEDERQLCEYVKKNLKSDFVFITRFPTKKRAFYTYEEPSEAPFSRGFDLLFRGLEINSGAQRIHNHEDLVRRIVERGMDPEKFSYYLQTFKVGMPPHAGSSTGLERFTARMLEVTNVKEATAFPRDMTRIDTRLSE